MAGAKSTSMACVLDFDFAERFYWFMALPGILALVSASYYLIKFAVQYFTNSYSGATLRELRARLTTDWFVSVHAPCHAYQAMLCMLDHAMYARPCHAC